MNTKHTKGPRKTIELDELTYINPDRGEDEFALIARVNKPKNAKLIEAAPDLLEACKTSREYITILENFISDHLHLRLPVLDHYQDPLDKLESAILKAGE